jgi:SAM-dependent methyltransferase
MANPQAVVPLRDFVRLCETNNFNETRQEIEAFLFSCLNHLHSKPLTGVVRVCEIGCGFGRLYTGLVGLKEYTIDYVGVDASLEAITLFRQKHSDANVHVADICVDDLSHIGKFDVIFLPYTFIHLFEFNEQKDILAKLKFLLEDGGVIIVDILDPQLLGESGDCVKDAIILKESGDTCQLRVYMASRNNYPHLVDASGLSIKGGVPYKFGGISRQEYLVLGFEDVKNSRSSDVREAVAP